ncbi:MAG: ATP-binding cassette domain-containing protein [Thermomicrobiales bacterium]
MSAQDPQQDEVLLSVRNVTKYFPVGTAFHRMQLRALSDVSFDLKRGHVLALVGESGSGKRKTTLAACCWVRLRQRRERFPISAKT